MKKLFYLLLLTLVTGPAALNAACSVCQAYSNVPRRGTTSGASIRQKEGAEWGQTQPAYRGLGSQQAEAEREG